MSFSLCWVHWCVRVWVYLFSYGRWKKWLWKSRGRGARCVGFAESHPILVHPGHTPSARYFRSSCGESPSVFSVYTLLAGVCKSRNIYRASWKRKSDASTIIRAFWWTRRVRLGSNVLRCACDATSKTATAHWTKRKEQYRERGIKKNSETDECCKNLANQSSALCPIANNTAASFFFRVAYIRNGAAMRDRDRLAYRKVQLHFLYTHRRETNARVHKHIQTRNYRWKKKKKVHTIFESGLFSNFDNFIFSLFASKNCIVPYACTFRLQDLWKRIWNHIVPLDFLFPLHLSSRMAIRGFAMTLINVPVRWFPWRFFS